MASQTATDLDSNPWNDLTLALLGGIAVFGSLVLHVAAVQTPVLSPPAEAIPLFVFNTTAAIISYLLVRRGSAGRYAAAAATGLLVVVSIGLIGGGFVGDLKPGTNPLGPLTYAALGLLLTGSAFRAWRRRTTPRGSSGASTHASK